MISIAACPPAGARDRSGWVSGLWLRGARSQGTRLPDQKKTRGAEPRLVRAAFDPVRSFLSVGRHGLNAPAPRETAIVFDFILTMTLIFSNQQRLILHSARLQVGLEWFALAGNVR